MTDESNSLLTGRGKEQQADDNSHQNTLCIQRCIYDLYIHRFQKYPQEIYSVKYAEKFT